MRHQGMPLLTTTPRRGRSYPTGAACHPLFIGAREIGHPDIVPRVRPTAGDKPNIRRRA